MDVHLISLLWQTFVFRGFIGEERLLAQSSRYMRIHEDAPVSHGHPLLPLEILQAPPPNTNLMACQACSRALSSKSFPIKMDYSYDTSRCWVCLALKVRAETRERIKQEAEQGKPRSRRRRYADPDVIWALDSPHWSGAESKGLGDARRGVWS